MKTKECNLKQSKFVIKEKRERVRIEKCVYGEYKNLHFIFSYCSFVIVFLLCFVSWVVVL